MKFCWQFAVVLFIAAMVPNAVFAASYKCVIDGKTTYQDRPCGEEVKARGRAETLTPPAPGSRGYTGAPPIVSKEENQRREGVTRRQFEPVARSAFLAMKDGRFDDYLNMLCPQPRASLAAKPSQDAWKSEGQRYKEAETELLASTAVDQTGVTFAIKNGPVTPAALDGSRQVRVHFLWVEDKPCVTRIDDRTD